MVERTAFVFTGGASLGAVHVGMLQALHEAGVHADLVVGASAGSINAVGYASGPDRGAAVAFVASVWQDIKREDLIQWEPGMLLGLLGTRRNHLFDVAHLRRLMRRHAPVERLEDTHIPCHLVATDLASGEEVVLSRGAALDAVLASAAIPGIWPPVEVDGRHLIDGGVGSHAPVGEAIALGATRIVLLPAGYSCRLGQVPRTALEVVVQALVIAQVRQLIAELEAHDGRVPIHVVEPPCPIDVSPYDFSQSGLLMERAHETAAAWLAAGGLRSTRLPPTLRRARGR